MQFKTVLWLTTERPQSKTIETTETCCFVPAKAGPRARLDSFFVGFTGGLVTSLRASNGQPAASLLFIHIHTQTATTRMLARNPCATAVEMDSYWLVCIEEPESSCRVLKSYGAARCLKVFWTSFKLFFVHLWHDFHLFAIPLVL